MGKAKQFGTATIISDKPVALGPFGLTADKPGAARRRGKYDNRKVEFNGHKFDSEKECRRYKQLQLLANLGQIDDLRLQVRYNIVVAGQKICAYVADFVYRDLATSQIV